MSKLIICGLLFVTAIAGPIVSILPEQHYYNKVDRNVQNDGSFYIVNGVDAKQGDNPHMCSIRVNHDHNCGASIISEEWLLTAAHCLYPYKLEMNLLTIRCAILNRDDQGGQEYKIADHILHPDYNRHTMVNDIALIKIDGKFQLGSKDMNKIDLPDQDQAVEVGAMITVTGWGSIKEQGQMSKVLQTLDIPIVANDVCNEDYNPNRNITEQMFCAGYDQGGKDACQGDSGGPAKLDAKIIGIISWGRGCAEKGHPGVYTRVASYIPWITDSIGV